jgi:glycosyltransferase involved in cell wall biosynthesis
MIAYKASTQLREKTLSILVPVYNESCVIDTFMDRLHQVIENLPCKTEVVFVDDGSNDDTCLKIERTLSLGDSKRLIKLSRNFGKEAALCAGLESVKGDALIILDADLQDPPELIPKMLTCWQSGIDVVNMCRSKREGETWFKKFSAQCFYRILNWVSDTHIPENVGDFRLIGRCVIDVINAMPEKNMYMKGILSWPGFRTQTLFFDRDARAQGQSKWPFFKLLKLAIDGIAAFSTKPLQIATWAGAIIASIAFIYGVVIVVKTALFGDAVAGYPTLIVTILALGGFQLLTVGIMGAYIGRIYTEVKNRPRYVVQEERVFHSQAAVAPAIDISNTKNKPSKSAKIHSLSAQSRQV